METSSTSLVLFLRWRNVSKYVFALVRGRSGLSKSEKNPRSRIVAYNFARIVSQPQTEYEVAGEWDNNRFHSTALNHFIIYSITEKFDLEKWWLQSLNSEVGYIHSNSAYDMPNSWEGDALGDARSIWWKRNLNVLKLYCVLNIIYRLHGTDRGQLYRLTLAQRLPAYSSYRRTLCLLKACVDKLSVLIYITRQNCELTWICFFRFLLRNVRQMLEVGYPTNFSVNRTFAVSQIGAGNKKFSGAH